MLRFCVVMHDLCGSFIHSFIHSYVWSVWLCVFCVCAMLFTYMYLILSGAVCQTRDAILLKDGCIILNDGKLDMYDARNKCVEKGGDLAVIGGPDDLSKFRQVFSRIPKGSKIWLGLRRQWWIWNVT